MADRLEASPEPEASGSRTVLVVEDEVLVRTAIAAHLRAAGFTVVEASNAAEAMAVLDSGAAVDFVFSDVQMPGDMDGAMLARWIEERHGAVPVLLTSGARRTIAALAASADRFVAKPYGYDEVERRIRSALARR